MNFYCLCATCSTSNHIPVFFVVFNDFEINSFCFTVSDSSDFRTFSVISIDSSAKNYLEWIETILRVLLQREHLLRHRPSHSTSELAWRPMSIQEHVWNSHTDLNSSSILADGRQFPHSMECCSIERVLNMHVSRSIPVIVSPWMVMVRWNDRSVRQRTVRNVK